MMWKAPYKVQNPADNLYLIPYAPMEQAFNADFSHVKIHTGNQSDTLNRSLSARAFTSGQDIFFRPVNTIRVVHLGKNY